MSSGTSTNESKLASRRVSLCIKGELKELNEVKLSIVSTNVMKTRSLGSRNLGGRNEDDYDFYYGRGYSEDPFEDEFVSNQRRFKDRASAAFEEDLADLRRKRRDMQDRMFDMTDLSAEIEKAKVTLGAADTLFQRHALRFDNEADDYDESISLASRIDRNRKIAAQEIPDPKPPVKWTKLVPVEEGCAPPPQLMARRISYGNNPYGDNNEPRGKRGYSKRKKSVSF
ncbi:hypothetical protein TSAR_003023 [Trichomalopsis sarcophagae]|uniref:Uncharacterized protein n=1 Tax=Trichomalopsis sarcophagae TaxID=543379 RepID=A0A232FH18_9HYME|nr:hypothetical protein TSAR_003023 [Trichomalopsis sarcophagae]